MQFVFLLLGLFTIACVLYGISAGVGAIQRGFSWLATDDHKSPSRKGPVATELPSIATKPSPLPKANIDAAQNSPMRRHIEELRELFLLYKEGALSADEFDGLKQHLLRSAQKPMPATIQKHSDSKTLSGA